MEILRFALYCLIVLFTLYPIVDRICKCNEQINVSKAFEKFLDSKLDNKDD